MAGVGERDQVATETTSSGTTTSNTISEATSGTTLRTSGAGARTCHISGLRLSPADGQAAYRIAKTTYGGLNPEQRPVDGDRSAWNRHDVPLTKTAYAGLVEESSYAEALADFRPSPLEEVAVGELFDNEPAPTLPVLEAVAQEWRQRGHMPVGAMPAGWRADRLMYRLTLPATGWFVDVTHSDSLASINRHLGPRLRRLLGGGHLTVAHLTSQDRLLTTTVAEWVYGLVLDDGSLPHGMVYPSKHGAQWPLYSIWLRAVRDGKPLTSEPTTTDEGSEITGCGQNPALRNVARLFDLTCH